MAEGTKKGRGPAGSLAGAKRKALSDMDDNNDEDGNDASDKGGARKKRTRAKSNGPRLFNDKLHVTGYWAVYNPTLHTAETVEVIKSGENTRVIVSDIEHYPLWKGNLPVEEIDISRFCRLDDLTVGFLLQQDITRQSLGKRWPVEFDQRGMTRATRLPQRRGGPFNGQGGSWNQSVRIASARSFT